MWSALPPTAAARLYPHVNGTAPVFPMEYIEGMNADLQDQGYIVQADTVEELADKLGLPKDTFTATVDRYNELAAKGEDEDYGKEDYRLSTLSEAPFYGVRQSGGYLICTMDGIQIDDNMHALDHDFKAIPGLYVIGDMSGNYFSGSYPCLMAGCRRRPQRHLRPLCRSERCRRHLILQNLKKSPVCADSRWHRLGICLLGGVPTHNPESLCKWPCFRRQSHPTHPCLLPLRCVS